MSNQFRGLADKIGNSPFVIIIMGLFTLLLAIGLSLSVESYSTTLAAYHLIPTNKIHPEIFPLVALLPSVGFITFLYMYLRDTSQRWALWATGVFFLVDMTTDVMAKSAGRGWEGVLWAIPESFFLFTIGAHCITTLASGMLLELWPNFITQFGLLMHRTAHSSADVAEKFADSAVNRNGRAEQHDLYRNLPMPPDIPPMSYPPGRDRNQSQSNRGR